MSSLGVAFAILVVVCPIAVEADCGSATSCTDETSLLQLQQSVQQGTRQGKGQRKPGGDFKKGRQRCHVAGYCDIGAMFPVKQIHLTAEQISGAKQCFHACRNPNHDTHLHTAGSNPDPDSKVDIKALLLLGLLQQPMLPMNGSYGYPAADGNRSYGYPRYVQENNNNNNNNNNNGGYGYNASGNASGFRPLTQASGNASGFSPHTQGSQRGNSNTEVRPAAVREVQTDAAREVHHEIHEALHTAEREIHHEVHKEVHRVEQDYDPSTAKDGDPCVCSVGQQGYAKLDRVKLFIPDHANSESAAQYCEGNVRVRGRVSNVIRDLHNCCTKQCILKHDQGSQEACREGCEDYFGIVVSSEDKKMLKKATEDGLVNADGKPFAKAEHFAEKMMAKAEKVANNVLPNAP